ncbi:MAG: hypothetical protein AMS14_11755 [Planctomycetes bacterium DG_20]|nr:MAG: hypothetical protein AMS14_11755 [Planctomycetes bacterium DG_20]
MDHAELKPLAVRIGPDLVDPVVRIPAARPVAMGRLRGVPRPRGAGRFGGGRVALGRRRSIRSHLPGDLLDEVLVLVIRNPDPHRDRPGRVRIAIRAVHADVDGGHGRMGRPVGRRVGDRFDCGYGRDEPDFPPRIGAIIRAGRPLDPRFAERVVHVSRHRKHRRRHRVPLRQARQQQDRGEVPHLIGLKGQR